MAADESRSTYITIHDAHGISTVGFKRSTWTDEENIELLGRELFALVEQDGCRKVILDMDQVSYVTSSVLGKLISLHRKLHRIDGRLVICNLGQELNEIMTTSRLNQFFHLADDPGTASALLDDD